MEGRNFFSVGNIRSILTLMSVLGFIAIGQTLVILVGSLDLSVPYVASLTSVLAGGVMAGETGNVLPGVLVALGVAALIGLANGAIVAGLGVHGFVATLGVGLVISGYLATNYQGNFGSAPVSFRLVGALQVGPVPVSALIMFGCDRGRAVVALVVGREAAADTSPTPRVATKPWTPSPADDRPVGQPDHRGDPQPDQHTGEHVAGLAGHHAAGQHAGEAGDVRHREVEAADQDHQGLPDGDEPEHAHQVRIERMLPTLKKLRPSMAVSTTATSTTTSSTPKHDAGRGQPGHPARERAHAAPPRSRCRRPSPGPAPAPRSHPRAARRRAGRRASPGSGRTCRSPRAARSTPSGR